MEIKTKYQKLVEEYGVENIFLEEKDYKSCYHDDYCTYTYYNNITGEFSKGEWTTAAYIPTTCEFDPQKSVYMAYKDGSLNQELYFAKKREKWLAKPCGVTDIYDTYSAMRNVLNRGYGIRVSVTRGRKFKGDGILVGFQHKTFGYHSQTTAVILADGQENYASFNMLNFDIKAFEEWQLAELDKAGVEWFFNEDVRKGLSDYIIKKFGVEGIAEDYHDAQAKIFKVNKMVELLEWAKTKTDDVEEQKRLAERVWYKNYVKY